jgi:hypothetical protein
LIALAAMLPLGNVSSSLIDAGRGFPYRAFSELPSTPIKLKGGSLEVAFAPGSTILPRADILGWAERSARSVVSYYGRLPTPTAKVLFVPVPGREINGTTYGYGGAASRVVLGSDATAADLEADWVLIHKLVHHGFPFIVGPRDWMHEGVATYVEPIARAQSGLIPVDEVWRQLVVGLPQGQPRRGDRGLDGTPTWGRTYWGGAMFFLLADVELRRRTGNRTGLQQVLQSTVAEGGNITQQWTIDRFNAVGARATGTDVLGELYECMKDTPRNVDLIALWRDLGVKLVGRNVQYDDAAQLAHIRGAITARLASPVRESLSALRPGLVERSQVNAEPKQYSGNEAPCRSFPWISER